MASEYTTNRRYPLYTDQDKPNLRDQYNGAIRMIDGDIDDALDASGHVSDALGAGFDAQHTVRMALDNVDTQLGAGFDAQHTVRMALDNVDTQFGGVAVQLAGKASTTDLNAVKAVLPFTEFSAQNTIKDALDRKVPNSALDSLATKQEVLNEATARANADTALGSRISSLENPTRYIATIGDSFGNESSEWAALAATKLGYQLINRCTNEAGFSYTGTDGKTFTGQLQDIKANSHFANVEYIIVYGGVNDFTMQITKENEVSAINQFMSEYNSISGRKPKLIFAFGNFGNGLLRNRAHLFPEWYNYVTQKCRENGVPIVEYVPVWLACTDVVVYNTDNLHPNSLGENMIASYIENLVNGTYNGVHRRHVGTYDGNMYTTADAEISDTRVAYTEILTLDNNKLHVTIRPSASYSAFSDTRFSGNTWYSMRTPFADSRYWCTFGTQNEAIEPTLKTRLYPVNNPNLGIAVKVNTSTGVMSANAIGTATAFNFGTRQLYWQCFGSITTFREAYTSGWPTPTMSEFEYTII